MEKNEIRQVKCKDQTISFCLTRKNVKNVNLRVKLSGEICVSANRRVPLKYIDSFVIEKQDMIFHALERFAALRDQIEKEQQNGPKAEYTEEETSRVLNAMCQKVYPRFIPYGIGYPQIKIRTMKSKWGSCHPAKGIITLNSRLMEAPEKCIEYVVVHEFSHFIHPNHSKDFYAFVEAIMPDWKAYREELKKIH